MRKSIIITFITILIIQLIIPIKINAFVEQYEIISEPAKIEKYKEKEEDIVSPTTGLDIFTGFLIEPTVKFVTFFIDATMSIFSSIMKQIDSESFNLGEFEYVMIDKEEIDEIQNIGVTGAEFPISDMTPYESATGSLEYLKYPKFPYSPEEIFAGNIDLFSIDFITGNTMKLDSEGNVQTEANTNKGWNEVRVVISKWYKIFRMIAIIGLLSVLIYTGIKIITSAVASEKAKYKELIVNWFIAVILAFSMHYIMAFILNITKEVTTLLQGITGLIQVNAGGTSFQTNLIGLARFQMQKQLFSAKIGHLIIYTALITYTVKFTFVYIKRMLKMAFLTIISPVVALTYPIDKMNGEAQGFKMWLREFIYNALLQPMHCILYYILVSSALSLAANNPIYGIVAIMFISEAEKILKKIFGFGKARAGTVGGIAGAFATGAVTSSLIKHVKDPLHPFGRGFGGGSSSSGRSGGYDYPEIPNHVEVNEDADFENYIDQDIRSSRTSTPGPTPTPTPTPNPRNGDPTAIKNIIPNIDDLLQRYDGNMPGLIAELQSGNIPGVNQNNINDVIDMIRDYQDYRSGGAGRRSWGGAQSGTGNSSSGEGFFNDIPMIRGVKNVGKTILKPAWDTEKDFAYNARKIRNKALTGVAGATLGVAAAAVQAGISITDGKYNVMEGIATVGAGIAGASGIAKSAEKEIEKHKEDDKNIEKYANEWYNNDKVINYFNQEFHGKGKEMRKRASKNYVTRGITDLQQQKQALKFAEQLKEERGMDEDEADKLAVATLQYKQSLNGNYSVLFDKKKRTNYLNARADAYTGAASRASIIKLHDDFLLNVSDFNRANE